MKEIFLLPCLAHIYSSLLTLVTVLILVFLPVIKYNIINFFHRFDLFRYILT